MLHYRPTDGYFGDPIPFFWEGTYHVFYLKAPLEPVRNLADHTQYAHISTCDFLHWTEHPIALSPIAGGPDAVSCWTGSIFEHAGRFFLFYTGYDKEHPTHPQSICLATSTDLDHWERHNSNPILLADRNRFVYSHWRDPFVFWSESENCFLMSITTATRGEADWRGGALVIARSHDLLHWDTGETFYQPGNHCCPECSDIFKSNGKWYMVASMFLKTCYRIGASPLGPWRATRFDSFDGPMNYAAKTISDGQKRYVIGWIRTKTGCRDDGAWEWGGHMSLPKEIVPAADGNLYVKLPDQFNQARGERQFDLAQGGNYKTVKGEWEKTSDGLRMTDESLFGEIQIPGSFPRFDLSAMFTLTERTRCAGVVFFGEEGKHPGYEAAIDMHSQALTFRPHGERFHRYACQDLELKHGEKIELRLIVEETLVEVFINGKFALGSRFYHQPEDRRIGFFVDDGNVTLEDFVIHDLVL